jgi:hypothetical protein
MKNESAINLAEENEGAVKKWRNIAWKKCNV